MDQTAGDEIWVGRNWEGRVEVKFVVLTIPIQSDVLSSPDFRVQPAGLGLTDFIPDEASPPAAGGA